MIDADGIGCSLTNLLIPPMPLSSLFSMTIRSPDEKGIPRSRIAMAASREQTIPDLSSRAPRPIMNPSRIAAENGSASIQSS